MDILGAIVEGIKTVLEDENIEINGQSELINDIGLDSLQLVNLLLDLEEKLDLILDYEEMDFDEIITVSDLAKYIENAS